LTQLALALPIEEEIACSTDRRAGSPKGRWARLQRLELRATCTPPPAEVGGALDAADLDAAVVDALGLDATDLDAAPPAEVGAVLDAAAPHRLPRAKGAATGRRSSSRTARRVPRRRRALYSGPGRRPRSMCSAPHRTPRRCQPS
jgi:hypothetical protein